MQLLKLSFCYANFKSRYLDEVRTSTRSIDWVGLIWERAKSITWSEVPYSDKFYGQWHFFFYLIDRRRCGLIPGCGSPLLTSAICLDISHRSYSFSFLRHYYHVLQIFHQIFYFLVIIFARKISLLMHF